MTPEHDVDRRTVLKGTLALGATVSVAGCSALPFGGGGGDDGLSYGAEIDGELEEGDETEPFRDVVADSYEFTGSSGDEVVITMESQAIDTYLSLARDGEAVTNDDDSGPGSFDSQIETTLPEDGTYTIWASRYDSLIGMTGQEYGEYTLTLEEA